jgi:crotonobetainyl-CoA:carnitine CoA-transferase CaiB-like acyl-CoA transferase
LDQRLASVDDLEFVTMAGCLDGTRVLELARYQAGPRCGMILSDLGAEVIKIEPPGGETNRHSPPIVRGQSLYFSVYNRGKKSICLDLRQPGGRSVLRDLVATADFVLENFKPGTIDQMGFGYEALCEIKPDIILISASGFGQYGPYRDQRGFDPLGQAMSGLMTLTGLSEGKPIATASSVVDRYTALHATIGALAALHHRNQTGEGQVVDVCLLDSALTMVEIPTSYYLSTGEEGGEKGRPPYRGRDGWVVISTGSSPAINRKLSEVIGTEIDDTETIGFGLSPGQSALVEWCADRTVDDICRTLVNAGIPVSPVLSIPQVAVDPHLWEREMLVKMPDPLAGELYLPGLTIKFSKSRGKIGPVPTPGQHTNEILTGLLSYDSDRIRRLRAEGAI